MGNCVCCHKATDRTYHYYYAGTVVDHKVQQYQTTWTKGRTISTKYTNFQQMTGCICEDCSTYKDTGPLALIVFVVLFISIGVLSFYSFSRGAYFWGGLSALVLVWCFNGIILSLRSGVKCKIVTLSPDKGARVLIEKLHRRNINQLGIQVYFTPSEYRKLH